MNGTEPTWVAAEQPSVPESSPANEEQANNTAAAVKEEDGENTKTCCFHTCTKTRDWICLFLFIYNYTTGHSKHSEKICNYNKQLSVSAPSVNFFLLISEKSKITCWCYIKILLTNLYINPLPPVSSRFLQTMIPLWAAVLTGCRPWPPRRFWPSLGTTQMVGFRTWRWWRTVSVPPWTSAPPRPHRPQTTSSRSIWAIGWRAAHCQIPTPRSPTGSTPSKQSTPTRWGQNRNIFFWSSVSS